MAFRETSPLLGSNSNSKHNMSNPELGNTEHGRVSSYHALARTTSVASQISHCHEASEIADLALAIEKRVAKRKLIIASGLCLLFMVGEIIGGALANSLAIMTDAAHLLTDFASFLISLLALYLASRPATKSMSFGWHRAEVLGALVSVLLIWVVTGILVYLAAQRIISGDYEIEGKIMLITSGVGVGVNVLMAATLHQHGHTHGGGGGHGHSHGGGDHTPRSEAMSDMEDSAHIGIPDTDHIVVSDSSHEPAPKGSHENLNVRAAFIHVIGDLLQSIGVLIAAFVIYFKPEYKIADPICTFLFSVFVCFTTLSILRDTMRVLMEATPKGIDFNEVKEALAAVPGVLEVHDLRLWSLTMNKTALSVHLALNSHERGQEILRQATSMVRRRFNLTDVTIQLEEYVEQMADCVRCQDPKD